MIEEKIKFIPVIFKNIDINNLEVIRSELINAIDYFEKKYKCMCSTLVSRIEVDSKEMIAEDGSIINGVFNSKTRVLKMRSKISNINKYRNTVIHELNHAKFNTDLACNDTNLFMKNMMGDFTIYLINEYMACKNSAEYSYDFKEMKEFYKLQDSYLYNKKHKTDKEIATLISMIIVSEEIIRRNGGKTKGIYISEIKNIKNELEKIDFIPTLEQYENLKRLLLKYNFKC